MPTQNIFNALVAAVFVLVVVSVGGFGDTIRTSEEVVQFSLLALSFLAVWISVSFVVMLGPLLKATPKSLTTGDANMHSMALGMPGSAAMIAAGTIGFKYWAQCSHEPLYLMVLAAFIVIFLALISASMVLDEHLTVAQPKPSEAAPSQAT